MSHEPQSSTQDLITQHGPITYTQVRQNTSSNLDSHLKVRRLPPWRIGLATRAKMLGLLALGILSALGHHLLYSYLDNKPVRTLVDGAPRWKTQDWITRYGLALAFITKTILAASVAVAYKQRIWTNLRQKAYTVSGINAMYDATTDILSFASLEFVWKAKLATILAALTWTIPLSALVTPSSLLVTLITKEVQQDMIVPILNFADLNSDSYVFNGPTTIISPLLTKTTAIAAFSAEILPMAAVAQNISYTLQFHGPSLRCDEATEHIAAFVEEVWEATRSAHTGSGSFDAVYLCFTASNFLV
ncbi:hypothetical protein BHE90_008576 [Fusarium euwallaceae]|uniref:Uncharacterized protein n=1 Tax=Fusarium euwallaceae TaxID=1147111 RepID=A0A430LML7_9HYPO|nr:hypothetical protein BHE90_008576 [Fusarium euwallaceae]